MAHKRKRKSKRRKQMEALVYRKTHKDYKGRFQGKPSIMVLRKEGSTIVPVEELTIKELVSRLPRR
jgi:hypothetical protein